MNEAVRKAFKENPISHSGAHYLMTVHELEDRKWYARAKDVALALDVSAPSCLQSLKQLVKNGYLQMNEDKFYRLTQQGYQQVLLIEKNKEIMLLFFEDILWVSFEQADEDSCKVEHLISPEVSVKLSKFLKYCEKNDISYKKILAPTCWDSKEK